MPEQGQSSAENGGTLTCPTCGRPMGLDRHSGPGLPSISRRQYSEVDIDELLALRRTAGIDGVSPANLRRNEIADLFKRDRS